MSVKIGDKVRFLNAVGGGIVKRFIDKNLVSVEEDDGFETPVLIRECVVIEPAEGTIKPAPKVTSAPVEPRLSKDVTPQPEIKKEKKPEIVETPEGEQLSVMLAFLPNQPKSLQNTTFDCYLVNDSNYYLFVNYMNKSGNLWNSRYSGVIEPNIKIFMEEFSKEDLNDLERVCIQFIAYKENKPFRVKNPASVELKIDTVKFYKLHSFRENDYFDEEALIFPIVKNDIPEKTFHIDPKALERAMKEKQAAENPRQHPDRKKEPSQVIEVDLHATELLDTLTGMSNADILHYQLEKFNETLAAFQGKKGQKIVFIHGKGDGVLRKAILDELKTKYKGYYFQDASFREYGYGATMVQIR
ncbi:MAG: DUF2027 domain-containing protein [Candidatus Azobacteroides sp.]|nr:DUF2027 domain-containing protein [Candidatus Azobacteroides sp.]